jgi:hypothetical protein
LVKRSFLNPIMINQTNWTILTELVTEFGLNIHIGFLKIIFSGQFFGGYFVLEWVDEIVNSEFELIIIRILVFVLQLLELIFIVVISQIITEFLINHQILSQVIIKLSSGNQILHLLQFTVNLNNFIKSESIMHQSCELLLSAREV